MPGRDYHESLWEHVPEGLEPPLLGLRLRFLLAHVRAGQRVLDVGCGEGRFTAAMADAGALVTGIDVAAEPLRRASARSPELDLRRVASEDVWPLKDSSFDAVWAGEVIEHVADTAAWLSEIRRVLRSGGTLLLSTPAHDRLTRLALAVSSRAFDSHFDPRSDHLRFYTRSSIVALLEDFGFHRIAVQGVGGLPGNRRTLLVAAQRLRF